MAGTAVDVESDSTRLRVTEAAEICDDPQKIHSETGWSPTNIAGEDGRRFVGTRADVNPAGWLIECWLLHRSAD